MCAVASISMIQVQYQANGYLYVHIVTSNSNGAYGYVTSVCTISFGLSTVMDNQNQRMIHRLSLMTHQYSYVW